MEYKLKANKTLNFRLPAACSLSAISTEAILLIITGLITRISCIHTTVLVISTYNVVIVSNFFSQ